MKLQYEQDELLGKIIVFFDKDDLEIVSIVKPNNSSINIEELIRNFNRDNLDFIIDDMKDYDYYSEHPGINSTRYVDVKERKLKFAIHKLEVLDNNKNLVYNNQTVQRPYSFEQLCDMYNEDYINFSLRNIINAGVFDVRFVPIKDLYLRNRIVGKRWDRFCSDPFLGDFARNKILLGRSIVAKGDYWPFIVSTLNDHDDKLYIFEGNHRGMSLKLLQETGELSMDHEALCIIIPFNYMKYKNTQLQKPLVNPVPLRGVIETIYGSSILENNDLYKSILKDIKASGNKMHNEYTMEYNGKNVEDIIFTLHSYPLWLRDIIYNYKDDFVPSKIINNKELFTQWVKE